MKLLKRIIGIMLVAMALLFMVVLPLHCRTMWFSLFLQLLGTISGVLGAALLVGEIGGSNDSISKTKR